MNTAKERAISAELRTMGKIRMMLYLASKSAAILAVTAPVLSHDRGHDLLASGADRCLLQQPCANVSF